MHINAEILVTYLLILLYEMRFIDDNGYTYWILSLFLKELRQMMVMLLLLIFYFDLFKLFILKLKRFRAKVSRV